MNTQTEQIKAEIERIKKLIDDDRFLSEFEIGCNQGREEVCDDLIDFINSLSQEETSPCGECEGDGQAGTCAAISSLGRCPLEYRKTQEEVSEDLEEAADGYTRKVLERTKCLIGNQPVGEEISKAIKFGAKWQKEQMMKGAVDATIAHHYSRGDGSATGRVIFCTDSLRDFKTQNKVKLIIVKD